MTHCSLSRHRILVTKRSAYGVGGVASDRASLAGTLLAGLLKGMWDGHNLVAVEKKLVESHTRVLQIALKSLAENWSLHQPWLKLLVGYRDEIRRSLAALDDVPSDEKLDEQINKTMQSIHDHALSQLSKLKKQYAARGSVPEDLGEKVKGVHHEVSMVAEEYLMPWLTEGFRPAREETPDELERWAYGIPLNLKTRSKTRASRHGRQAAAD